MKCKCGLILVVTDNGNYEHLLKIKGDYLSLKEYCGCKNPKPVL